MSACGGFVMPDISSRAIAYHTQAEKNECEQRVIFDLCFFVVATKNSLLNIFVASFFGCGWEFSKMDDYICKCVICNGNWFFNWEYFLTARTIHIEIIKFIYFSLRTPYIVCTMFSVREVEWNWFLPSGKWQLNEWIAFEKLKEFLEIQWSLQNEIFSKCNLFIVLRLANSGNIALMRTSSILFLSSPQCPPADGRFCNEHTIKKLYAPRERNLITCLLLPSD